MAFFEYIILAATCSPTSGFEVKQIYYRLILVKLHTIPTTTTTTSTTTATYTTTTTTTTITTMALQSDFGP